MTVVEKLSDWEQACARYPDWNRDTLTLSWEERRRAHGKRTSDKGIVFAMSLPIGTVLSGDDCLELHAEQTLVRVEEASEQVYILTPKSPQEWAYLAYQIGNRHQSLMITDDELICPREPAVKSLLEQLGVPYTSASRPFTAVLHISGHSH